MKLSDWAKNKESAINKIAWRLYKQGHIKEYQLPTIIVQEEQRRKIVRDVSHIQESQTIPRI